MEVVTTRRDMINSHQESERMVVRLLEIEIGVERGERKEGKHHLRLNPERPEELGSAGVKKESDSRPTAWNAFGMVIGSKVAALNFEGGFGSRRTTRKKQG
jgi:hypothetical protein